VESRATDQPAPIIPHGGPEELFGLGVMRAKGRQAIGSMTTGPWLRGNDGRASAGSLGVLLDDVLGQAIHLAYRPPDSWSVTTELSIDFRARSPLDSSRITADAEAVDTSPSGGLARGQAFDEHGRLLAIATTWHRYAPGVPASVLAPQLPPAVGDRGESMAELLGARIEGETLVVAWRPELGNPLGVVIHGGIVAAAAELAGTRALAAPGLETESLRIIYLRPAEGEVTFEPRIVHRGRSLAVVEVVARAETGKPCAHTTLTYRSPRPA
jgi:uncharacterized protein (TIGR00369 family)